jgi:hypothetical protein
MLLEIFNYRVVFMLVHEVLELLKNAVIFTRIKASLLLNFKHLQLKEKTQKLIIPLHLVYIYSEEGFNAFEAFCEFGHGSIM